MEEENDRSVNNAEKKNIRTTDTMSSQLEVFDSLYVKFHC